MRRLILIAALLFAPAAQAAVAIDAVLTSGHQDGITGSGTAADFVSATFNVAASRLVVVVVEYESDTGNLSTTLSWTGGTPACASSFTKQKSCTYDDGVGDDQGAVIWTAWATSACTGVGVTHHNAVNIVNGIALVAGVYSISGGQQALPIGASGCGPATSALGTSNVTVNAVNTGSMILGITGTSDTAGTLTANGATTSDVSILAGGTGNTGMACHATSLTSGAGNVTIGATDSKDFRMAAAIEINDASITAGSGLAPAGNRRTRGAGR